VHRASGRVNAGLISVHYSCTYYFVAKDDCQFEFEWDENKRRAVIEKHDVDFRRAASIFDGPIVTYADDRRDYGEKRFISTGMGGR
jgi:hypothetical protein